MAMFQPSASLFEVNESLIHDFFFLLQVFQASTALYSVVQQKLSQVVKARFVRFFPITYSGHPCLAVEIYILTHGF